MPQHILGLSAYYHDSAAVLLSDGEIIAAAQEERFSRKKHDADFPRQAVGYVLEEGGLSIADLSAVCFYDKPYIKFERLLETYHAFAPKGLRSFLASMPVWIKEKLFLKRLLRQELETIAGHKIERGLPLLFPEHHLSHAASAFYPSPFEQAAILTIDGVGEWATTTIGSGQNSQLQILKELHFPHSVGLLYSAFTYFCGFKVNSGEYKLMGLAPYGNPESTEVQRYQQLIREHLVDLRPDGSLLLNLDYFNFATELRMCNDRKWESLFGLAPRKPESELTQPYMDLALAIQQVTETVVLRLANTAKALTGLPNLVMAGGVALNCVANGKLLNSRLFDRIWIQPAAGDAGGALGAAYAAWHIWGGQPHQVHRDGSDKMAGCYLGPAFPDQDIRRLMRRYQAMGEFYDDFDELCQKTARRLADGCIVGWFQGRLEWGPRALGNRSILGDPRWPGMQKKMNLKIKYREGFRPFAPSVLAKEARQYFDLEDDSPYMLLVAPVAKSMRHALPDNYASWDLYERLYHPRSEIPAVTHVDFSARIQTVHQSTNPAYWRLIRAFQELTGLAAVVNTSFNVRGEPIVCSPEDAYRCFMRTNMDYLVINNFLFAKERQPAFADTANWREDYPPD